MKKTILTLLGISFFAANSNAWDTPTMGWSSWNAFGHRINEEIIRSQADALISTGLKDAGYIYVNIDDGAWCGREADGHLKIHPDRFPNGLKPLIDQIHSSGLKAGTYSDAGHNTCASFYGGDKDGIGTGLYEHDIEDAIFMFNDLGFDFIKVDFCGGDAPQNSEHLELNEQERYTAISKAIKATGRNDVRYNVCRWAYPGTWVEDVASSWRMSQDIYLGWESVKDIIHQNLYLSAYATKGRFNDMDMLEVGRGLSDEEDKTHFGMWCMMSSPLLIGCDLRGINQKAIDLLSNPELIALNQDPLALQATVVKRDKGAYVLVKDVDMLRGNTRAVAFYNPTDASLKMSIDFFDIDLGEEAEVRDLFERKDIGLHKSKLEVTVPPHATRIYRVKANKRLERRLYEGETAFIPTYQELDNNQAVKSGVYEELDGCSGGAKASWLGARESNELSWRDVWSDEGGEYDLTIHFITGENRKMTVTVNGKDVNTLTVNSNSWSVPSSVSLKVKLNKGENVITFSNPSAWMPDIDCMTITREGDLQLCIHRHQQAIEKVNSFDLSSLPEKMRTHFESAVTNLSSPEANSSAYDEATASLNNMAIEIEEALLAANSYQMHRKGLVENIEASSPSEALTLLEENLTAIDNSYDNADNCTAIYTAISDIESAQKAYLSDENACLKEGASWDMTCFIVNPSFDQDSHGWNGEPVWGSHVAEYWNRTFSAFQTVKELRNGYYTLSVQALYRVASNDGGVAYKNGSERITALIKANDSYVNVASLYAHPLYETPELEETLSGTHVLRGYVNSMHGAEMAFSYGLYKNEIPAKVTDNTLRIEISSDKAEGDCWCCFDNFVLRYQGSDNNAVDVMPSGNSELLDIYTPSGICVAKGIHKSLLNNLPSGIYIANGKKLIIK
ncbi:MAG: hypothetical protein K2N35_17455 [Muribaculaceae bacterium]|nr:hypothetical protein [Muribaculaceae bacterium]